VEVADCGAVATGLVDDLRGAEVRTLVVSGFPPGTGTLLDTATRAGIATRVVLQSSMAQHGGEPVESAVVDECVDLLGAGALGRLGVAKEGLAEAFAALGIEASYVPNRLPPLGTLPRVDLGGNGREVGVFAEPILRKNVVTQLAAVALMGDARAHVLSPPPVRYVSALPVRVHGVLPHDEFLALQASVDLNLYVTLSECQPLTPMESYAAGVPCLVSPTSVLFHDDDELAALTIVDRLDDPVAIAIAAERLLGARDVAVPRAQTWLARWDAVATARFSEFVAS